MGDKLSPYHCAIPCPSLSSSFVVFLVFVVSVVFVVAIVFVVIFVVFVRMMRVISLKVIQMMNLKYGERKQPEQKICHKS